MTCVFVSCDVKFMRRCDLHCWLGVVTGSIHPYTLIPFDEVEEEVEEQFVTGNITQKQLHHKQRKKQKQQGGQNRENKSGTDNMQPPEEKRKSFSDARIMWSAGEQEQEQEQRQELGQEQQREVSSQQCVSAYVARRSGGASPLGHSDSDTDVHDELDYLDYSRCRNVFSTRECEAAPVFSSSARLSPLSPPSASFFHDSRGDSSSKVMKDDIWRFSFKGAEGNTSSSSGPTSAPGSPSSRHDSCSRDGEGRVSAKWDLPPVAAQSCSSLSAPSPSRCKQKAGGLQKESSSRKKQRRSSAQNQHLGIEFEPLPIDMLHRQRIEPDNSSKNNHISDNRRSGKLYNTYALILPEP